MIIINIWFQESTVIRFRVTPIQQNCFCRKSDSLKYSCFSLIYLFLFFQIIKKVLGIYYF